MNYESESCFTFRVGGSPPYEAKFMVDGALGANGAWMLEPYDNQPEWAGQNTWTLKKFSRSDG